MVNWGVVIIGFILAIVFSLIGGTVGLFGSAVGVLLAGVVLGYMVNKYLKHYCSTFLYFSNNIFH